MLSGDEFYLSAFHDLSTCRQLGFSIGPIPWKDIILYAQFAELDSDVLSIFVPVIRAMDNEYLKWVGKKTSNG